MSFRRLNDFLAYIHRAALVPKREWIQGYVAGKEVLDLGVVAHSLEHSLHHRDKWLHAVIKDHAASALGVDILEAEVSELRKLGYDIITDDVRTLRLSRKFDVVVCGDLIEHVTTPEALLRTIDYHLKDDGIGLITTPNPFAIHRFLNIVFDGWTDINTEHVFWLCPQTLYQLVDRTDLSIDGFSWLQTDFPMLTKRRFFGSIANRVGAVIERRRPIFHNDYGVVLKKKRTAPRTQTQPQPQPHLPFISVIIPTYNRAHFMEMALRSLLAQDYPKDRHELIVVDNASIDGTEGHVRILAEQVRDHIDLKYIREKRRGLVYARHTGAAHARGEILLFGDDDALFDENWIASIADMYVQYPEVGAVGTKIAIQWDREPDAWVRRYEGLLGRLDYGHQALVRPGLFINGGSFSIRRDCLVKVGGFNPGQIGDDIIGDSETGLCRKLAIAEVPVGWTPAATMRHLQQADVNGTWKDIKRRHRNYGISEAYGASFYAWTTQQVLRDAARKTWKLLRQICRILRDRDWNRFSTNLPLELAFYTSYVKFLWLYRYSKVLRRVVTSRDWAFTPAYSAPPIRWRISDTTSTEAFVGRTDASVQTLD